MTGEMRVDCAVVGVSTTNSEINAAQVGLFGLHALQNRGDAASGMASMTYEGEFAKHRKLGEVKDVYSPEDIAKLAGSLVVGHNRYATSGSAKKHLTPVIDEPLGLALSMNGHLSVTGELEHFLASSQLRISSFNDTELKTHSIAQVMRRGKELPEAIEEIYPMLRGGFSTTAMQGDTLVAFRDPLGIRPLNMAKIDSGYMVASETAGFYPVRGEPFNAHDIEEIKPGEMVVITKGDIERKIIVEADRKFDIFELVYFSNPESEYFDESVGMVRYRIGQELAQQHPLEGDNYLVCGLPDSAIPMGQGYARSLGLEYGQFITKNRYKGGRSFMQPTDKEIQIYLEAKLNYIAGFAKGRDVVYVDDTIVRLNTARKAVELAMRAGAKSVTYLVGSPPIGYPDFSGIDTPSQDKLIAAHLTPEQIRQKLGIEGKLGYLALSRLIRATGQPREVFNLASFTGEYPYEIGTHQSEIKRPASLDYLEQAA